MADIDEILYILTFVFEIGSVLSIVLLTYGVYIVQKIKGLFPGGNIVKKWIGMQIIMIIFIFLYIMGLILIFAPDQRYAYIVNGILNLFTGIFVIIIINLNYKTYKIILGKTNPA